MHAFLGRRVLTYVAVLAGILAYNADFSSITGLQTQDNYIYGMMMVMLLPYISISLYTNDKRLHLADASAKRYTPSSYYAAKVSARHQSVLHSRPQQQVLCACSQGCGCMYMACACESGHAFFSCVYKSQVVSTGGTCVKHARVVALARLLPHYPFASYARWHLLVCGMEWVACSLLQPRLLALRLW